jgi:hypothetical protein
MAQGTLTITLLTNTDLPEASYDEKPEQFTGLIQEVVEKFQRQLGPDAGRPGTVVLSSVTFT